ncbi:MAG: phosphate regulon sensor histidine kinase PhoR [Burkholderiaceae bacterium]
MFGTDLAFALVAVLALAGLAGWWFSPLWAALFLAFVLLVAVLANAWLLEGLYRWASTPGSRDVPAAPLFWGRLFDRIARFAQGEADARRALGRDAATARSIVDWLPDALILLGPRDQLEWHNQAAQELFGYLGARRPVQQFIREPEFGAYLAERAAQRPLRIELSNHPGKMHEIRLHPLEDDRRLLICRDITQQARLDRMRSDFVANVSHEIRTPVTVISGFAETMIDLDLDAAKRQEYLHNIVRQSRTMQRLVSDLLTLSSLEHGPERRDDEVLELAILFEHLGAEARALSGDDHDITVVAPTALAVVGRASEIESAIRNLLTNAVRYTPAGGHIRLACARRDSDLWISVEDDGIGIAADHLPRLTERFYRVDQARSRSTGGTGLGLAIVKRIASRHGGNLHIESQPGKGSRFSLILPGSRVRALPEGDAAKLGAAA